MGRGAIQPTIHGILDSLQALDPVIAEICRVQVYPGPLRASHVKKSALHS